MLTYADVCWRLDDMQSPPNEIVDRGVHAMVRYMRAVDGAWWTKELDMSGQVC